MRLLFVAMLALAFAGAASSRSPGACTLLSNHDVATALKSTVVNRTPGAVGLAGSCTWVGTPLTNAYGQPSVLLALARGPGATFTKSERESNGQPVHGLGEAAVWFPVIEQLSAWYRGYAVSITVHGPYVAAPLAAEKSLIKAAFARL